MKRTYLILFIFLFASVNLYSQIGISIGPLLGISTPTIDYTGDASDFYDGTKYGMRTGLCYGVLGKVTIGPIKARLSFSYSTLDNNGVADKTKPNSSVEIKNNLLIIGVGTEFGMGIPKSPVKPYIGIELLFSSISGSFRFQGISSVNSNTNSIQSSSRTGLGLILGADISLMGVTRLDLSLRYNLINLFGKDYLTTNNPGRIDAYTNLNDAKDPNYKAGDDKHPIGNDRSIATLQVQVAILFGF